MNDLIQVNHDGERQTTSARELWEFLDKPHGEFMKWFSRYSDYGFTKGSDYKVIDGLVENLLGGRPSTDYEITLDMAKELAMLQKSEKGKVARQYFLELERRWNSPEAVMARALKMADKKLLECRHAVDAYNSFISKENLYSINEVSKKLAIPSMGEKNLFTYLRGIGILCTSKSHWNEPKQEHVNSGYFVLRDGAPYFVKGVEQVKKQTFVTPKGVDFIRRTLEKDGYVSKESKEVAKV